MVGGGLRALHAQHHAGPQPGQRPGEPPPPHPVHAPPRAVRAALSPHGAAGLLPPDHSKYNPVGRCWGILEQHGNGSLLDSLDAVLGFAETMTWKGTRPVVTRVTTTYQRGVTLSKAAMAVVEAHLTRLPLLEKWFVEINGPPAAPDT